MSNHIGFNNYTDLTIENAPPPYSPPLNSENNSNYYQESIPINKDEKFREIINKHEISLYFSEKLQSLSAFKIVFIFDDSGSMNTILNDSPLNSGLSKVSRWDELQYFAKISLEIANIFNDNGSDIYFLNRPTARNIQNTDQLNSYFHNKPSGFTPLSRVFRNVLNENSNAFLQESNLLVIIVTDGEPTDDNGRENISDFKKILKSKHKNVFVTIVSCTDDDTTMSYLDHWDVTIPKLDVVDDFRSERMQILKTRGAHFRFSFGDYVVKSLIGSIHNSLDKLDESNSNCCTIL